MFNAPDVTVSLWIKPPTVSGRRGLVAKRFAAAGMPLVITQQGACIGFEASDVDGRWPFNFTSPAVLKANQWTQVAVTIRRGVRIAIYADGRQVAEKKISLDRSPNNEPLILGREAWGGDPPKGDTPGPYVGLIDELKIWTRALAPAEIQAEYHSVQPGR